jgi:hypothetical protein
VLKTGEQASELSFMKGSIMFGIELLILGVIFGSVAAATAGDSEEDENTADDADSTDAPEASAAESSGDFRKTFYGTKSQKIPKFEIPAFHPADEGVIAKFNSANYLLPKPKDRDFPVYIPDSSPIDFAARFNADFDALSRVCRSGSQLPEDILGGRRALDELSRRSSSSGLSSDLERYWPR